MHTIVSLSSRARYARSIYLASLKTLGARNAYKRACELAQLGLSDRVSLRLTLQSL